MLQQATHTDKHRALEIYTYISISWTETLVDYNEFFMSFFCGILFLFKSIHGSTHICACKIIVIVRLEHYTTVAMNEYDTV
jgi:hypothetical protein